MFFFETMMEFVILLELDLRQSSFDSASSVLLITGF